MMREVIVNLLPAKTFNLQDNDLSALMDGLGAAFDRLYNRAKSAQLEAQPGTAERTLDRWYFDLALPFDSSEPLSTLQARASAIYTATGGQSPEYLRRQLQAEFPNVDFAEATGPPGSETLHYTFTGSLDTEDEKTRFETLVLKLFPLHLEYQDLTDVIELISSGVCGAAFCGASRTGAEI